jgi:hypothetical protein
MAFRFAEAWLFAAGLVLAAGGLAGVVAGTFFAGWLYGLLPPVIIDAAAVGGAATATGSALAVLAVLHLLAAALLRRGVVAVRTPAVVLAMTMGLLCIGWGVAALVSAVAGGGPAAALVAAGIGLGAVAIGYGWVARSLAGQREPPRAPA